MSFSRKNLFSEIRTRCESFKDEDYLKNAIAIIDSTVEIAEVDDTFLNEYYKLKRGIIFENTYSSTVVLGFIVGLIGSFAAAVADIFDAAGVPEIVKAYGTEVFIAVIIFGLAICGFVLYNGLNKQNCVLYPYLAKKMEDKIEKSAMKFSKPKVRKKRCKYIMSVKKFIKNNRVLSAMTFVASIITISYTLTSDLPELISGIGKWYKLSNDLSIGILINFIFYVFQIYIPQQEAEKNSFPAIKPELIMIVENIQEIMLVLESYLPDFREGKFDVSDNVVQYMLQNDINVRKGWARQFDLYQDFLPMINSVGGSLDKLLSSVFIQHCDRELIELLGKLKLNRFLKTLKDAEKDKFCSDGTYGDFPKYYPEFAGIYENLKQYAIGYNIRYLSPLTVKESQMYFKGISVEDYRDKGILHIYIDSTDEQ